MYNGHSLSRLLSEHGFQDVKVCGYREGKWRISSSSTTGPTIRCSSKRSSLGAD